MIETSLMVHDYPNAPEEKLKRFTVRCGCTIEIEVDAENIEEAEKYCKEQEEWEDYKILEIEDVIDYEVS